MPQLTDSFAAKRTSSAGMAATGSGEKVTVRRAAELACRQSQVMVRARSQASWMVASVCSTTVLLNTVPSRTLVPQLVMGTVKERVRLPRPVPPAYLPNKRQVNSDGTGRPAGGAKRAYSHYM